MKTYDNETAVNLLFDVKQTKKDSDHAEYLLQKAEDALAAAKEYAKQAKKVHNAAVKKYNNYF